MPQMMPMNWLMMMIMTMILLMIITIFIYFLMIHFSPFTIKNNTHTMIYFWTWKW